MVNYYSVQSGLYDATRWMFLYGRDTMIEQVGIGRGDCVLEIGCGTGKNFQAIQRRLQGSGQLIGVDCASPMLDKAARRTQEKGWKNVRLMDMEYGIEPIAGGHADVVLFSYSLSMFVDWKLALSCARSELRPGGRIGVVDFCSSDNNSRLFAEWLAVNHVQVDRPYEIELRRLFCERTHQQYSAWGGLWSFYLFAGVHCPSASLPKEAA